MNTKKARLFLVLIVSISLLSLSSCVRNSLDNIEPTPIDGLNVPSTFDWSTIRTAQLTVVPADKTNSPYYYTVAVYGENPLFNTNAALLTKGVVKLGSNFVANMVLPTSVDVVYVRQISPTGKQLLQSVDAKNGTILCDFSTAVSPAAASAAMPSLRMAGVAAAVDPTPAGSVVLTSSSGNVGWENNKNYVIPLGQTYKGSIALGQNSNLYIEGVYLLEDKKTSLAMADGGKIVIQSSGKLETSSDVSLSYHIGIIKNYGSVVSKGDFDLTSKSTLYNIGTMKFEKLQSSNADNQIVNDGQIDAVDMQIQSNPITNNGSIKVTGVFNASTNCRFYNNGSADFSEFVAESNSIVYNNCHLSVSDLMDVHGMVYNGYAGSLLDVATLQSDGTVYTLSENAIVDAESALFSTYRNYINGAGTGYALARFGEVKPYKKAVSKNITYQGKLEVECSDHQDNVKNNPFWLVEGSSVRWSEKGKSTTVIPSTGCNAGGNVGVVEPPQPPAEPTQFPILVHLTTDYTFLMEDNWPWLGDYDLNDLVVGLTISYLQNQNNKATEMTVSYTLKAVGASKRIAAAFQLDKVARGQVSSVTHAGSVLTGSVFGTEKGGLEAGQTKAVIPLFDDAHLLLNPATGQTTTLINTIVAGEYHEPVSNSIRIVFAEPIDPADLSIANLNFFIVTDAPSPNSVRSEVHLSGYAPTDKANPTLFQTAADNSLSGKKYTTADNMIWGMLVPVAFKYASEWKDITSVYPQFTQWCTSGGVENTFWYEMPTDKPGYVYTKE